MRYSHDMIGWHALLTSMERPVDESVTLALRFVRNDAVAVMMYGSRARGTERPDSDIDILAVVNDRPGSANYGNVIFKDQVATIPRT